jgi:hypothetical protein
VFEPWDSGLKASVWIKEDDAWSDGPRVNSIEQQSQILNPIIERLFNDIDFGCAFKRRDRCRTTEVMYHCPREVTLLPIDFQATVGAGSVVEHLKNVLQPETPS